MTGDHNGDPISTDSSTVEELFDPDKEEDPESRISFVLMMISSAIVLSDHKEDLMARQKPPVMTSTGPFYSLTEEDVKNDEYLRLSSYWYLLFKQMFSGLCVSMKFIEMRPTSSNPGGPC